MSKEAKAALTVTSQGGMTKVYVSMPVIVTGTLWLSEPVTVSDDAYARPPVWVSVTVAPCGTLSVRSAVRPYPPVTDRLT